MQAQVAACRSAEAGYLALLERHGVDTFRATIEALHDHAEALMRAEIGALPDGRYEFTDYLDGLGEAPEALTLKVSVDIDGDHLTVDWSGTSDQVPGAINCPIPFTKSAAFLVVKCLTEAEIPNFQGFIRPIHLVAPEGTLVNPRLPGACGARAIIGWRMLDALFGAFAQVVPERIPAAGEGGVSFPAIGGWHEGRPFVCTETLAGAWGALPDRDGVHGIPNPGGNITNQPVEMIEALYPVEIERYGLVQNSGGPGRFRGAPAFVRQYRLRTQEARLVIRSDRRRFLPYGLAGGSPGTPSWNILNPGPGQRLLPVMPMEAVQLEDGDVLCHISAGGGGHGAALERDPERVLADVIEEYITLDYARLVYGCVIEPQSLTLDATATATARQEMRTVGSGETPVYLRLFHQPLDIAEVRLVGERELCLKPIRPGDG
ncbi:MAG: hydantoinase B/oxoprolinase family protein, partial [Alphaproteobacteria bacterium]|nr:hydantoinase B/oxoprolinase family protein [Alphaproteobacteria bacterium]